MARAKRYPKKKDFIDSHRQMVERVRKADIARVPVDAPPGEGGPVESGGGSSVYCRAWPTASGYNNAYHPAANQGVAFPLDTIESQSGGFTLAEMDAFGWGITFNNAIVVPEAGLYRCTFQVFVHFLALHVSSDNFTFEPFIYDSDNGLQDGTILMRPYLGLPFNAAVTVDKRLSAGGQVAPFAYVYSGPVLTYPDQVEYGNGPSWGTGMTVQKIGA